MTVLLRLLGRPCVERDGVEGPRSRGRKSWAILAYLASADRPVPRERLASMLFGEADDPLGALRWSLADARRLLGMPGALSGEPLDLDDIDATIDVRVLRTSSWVESEQFARTGPLLEGVNFPGDPSFDTWLASERYHLDAVRNEVLREATLGRLAAGDPAGAVTSAQALVVQDPYGESGHVLLVRAFVELGDRHSAEQALSRCTALFSRELGHPPSAAVAAELDVLPPARNEPRRGAARALLDAGAAAVSAGAVDVGIRRLREAQVHSREDGDLATEIAALEELGYTLVHAVRGRDDAGAAALSRAITLADGAGAPHLAVAAHRELGYIGFLSSRYEPAFRHLDHADQLASPESQDRAAVAAIRGACLVDVARYGAARAELARAVTLSRTSEASRWLAWSLTMTARLHMTCGDHDAARPLIEEALEVANRIGWTGMLPWPESLLAELLLHAGDGDGAADLAGHAFTLGRELADPCWMQLAERVLALIEREHGRTDAARATLMAAVGRGGRGTEGWMYAHAQVLDTLAGLGPHYPTEGKAWVRELEQVAAAGGMQELLVRAQLHRAAMGETGAVETAAALAAGIENPALSRRIADVT